MADLQQPIIDDGDIEELQEATRRKMKTNNTNRKLLRDLEDLMDEKGISMSDQCVLKQLPITTQCMIDIVLNMSSTEAARCPNNNEDRISNK
jgi:uncharacterized protein YutE (UPF0331/DUF86 family)